jgi:WhiB family transcriptional regulator, redox-sensing transcriptional regulator
MVKNTAPLVGPRTALFDPKHYDWMDRAACKGMDTNIWYCENPHTVNGDRAREVCHTCPVKGKCLEHAITHREPDGIWGGKTWRQRRRIRFERKNYSI